MMLVRGEQVTFNYPDQPEPLFKKASFRIHSKSRIAIVGQNGLGKTTLLRLIGGAEKLSTGTIWRKPNLHIGCLAQEVTINGELSALEYLLGPSSAIPEYEIYKMIARLNMRQEILFQRISDLSAGARKRIDIVKLLLKEPDLMLLDEPTNHLDLKAIDWLESFLNSTKIPWLVTSHDSVFLDRCVSEIWEIREQGLEGFSGNYTSYRNEKQQRAERARDLYQNQQRKLKVLRSALHERRNWALSHQPQTGKNGYAPVYESITNFAKKAMKRAKNIEKRMEMMIEREEAKKPRIEKPRSLSLSPEPFAGRSCLRLENVGKKFDRWLFREISLNLGAGERLAFVGSNGAGKSTLLQMIHGLIPCDEGTIRIAPSTNVGYLKQEGLFLGEDRAPIEILLETKGGDRENAQRVLGSLGLAENQIYQKVSKLSQGEKTKVALGNLIVSSCNLLVLDEPTNHLEISTREAVEEALLNFSGSLVFTTHDRSLLQRLGDRIFDLDSGRYFWGGYQEFQDIRSQKGRSSPI